MPRCKKMILEQLEDTLLPALKVKADPDKETDCLDSKFGGVFYLPQGESIPQNPNGVPMEFLVQLNFSKLRAPEGFPKKGILQFFLDTDSESKFLAENEDGTVLREQYALRYYPEPDAALQQPIGEQEIVISRFVVTAIVDTNNKTRFELRDGVEIPPEFQRFSPGRWRYWLKEEGYMSKGRHQMTRLKGKLRATKKQEYASFQLLSYKYDKEYIALDSGYEGCSARITPELVRTAGYNLGDCPGMDAFAYDFNNWGCKLGGHPAIRSDDIRTTQPKLKEYSALLFQYDNTTKQEMEENTLCFFIKPEDLCRAKFDDVILWHHRNW